MAIKLKYSDTLSAVPTLVAGEVAINRRDKKLFYTDNNNAVQSMSLVQTGSIITALALASDAAANASTTAAKITGLDVALAAGTYTFQYYIRYQSSATTTGVKFSVNFTGTVTAFVVNMSYVDAAATASTGAPSQAQNASTAGVVGAYSARAKSNTASIGPTLSVDTLNADMLMIIEGLMIVSVAGNIELYHASETANSTTVKAGSSLIITKTA